MLRIPSIKIITTTITDDKKSSISSKPQLSKSNCESATKGETTIPTTKTKESVIAISKRTTQHREIMVKDVLDGDKDSIGYEITETTIPKTMGFTNVYTT